MTIRVVFVTSHPIQYQVPVFRLLASNSELGFSVLFAMLPNASAQGEGFGVEFEWDIPLLEGYDYKVLDNVSKYPGVTHWSGCDTPGIFAELSTTKPDVVVVNGWVVKTCLQTLWACKRLGIPCLVRGEANDLRQRASWKQWLQRILVRQYAACLYIGKANKAFYEARGVNSDKLFPAPYCVENRRFATEARSLQENREMLRRHWNIPSDAICFIFCGKFESKKHPVELLEAFSDAQTKQTNLWLLMIGDGELRETCEELARSRQLQVTFTGFLNQSEIVSAYVAADCLVLPSDAGETWGLVVNEAMACGLPAITSDQVGCAADLVDPGETGDIFDWGDWIALANKMVCLGQSRSLLTVMGKNARQRVKNYSPEAVAKGIYAASRSVSS